MFNMDQRIRVEIIKQALRAPISCIAKNAGEEGAVIVGELLKEGVAVELGFNKVIELESVRTCRRRRCVWDGRWLRRLLGDWQDYWLVTVRWSLEW